MPATLQTRRAKIRRSVFAVIFTMIVVLGCQAPSAATPMSPSPPSTPTRAVTAVVVPAGAEAAWAAARRDLAGRLNLSEEQISLQRAESVDWSDSSLGCPKPGIMYAQVITPGFRLILAASGASYEYHADRAGHVTACFL